MSGAATAPPRGRSILLVDDEAAILFALSDYLESRGWRVATAGSVAEALGELAARPFDAAVVDLRLSPGAEDEAEGFELVARIRERWPATRVMLLTACGTAQVEAEAERLGVAAFLQKPQPLDVLHRRLSDLLAAD